MRSIIFSLLFAFFFLTGGCTSYQTKKDRIVASAIWTAKKNIEVGRVSKAKSILEEASRIVPKPKDLDKIVPLTTNNGDNIVLLPQELNNKKIIIENTPEYKKAIEENASLAIQIREDNKYISELSRRVDDAIRTRELELESAKRKTTFSWILSLVSGLGLLGTIALVVFFPAALPIVISFIKGVFNWLIALIKEYINSFKKNG